MGNRIKEIMKQTPLETRIKVTVQAHFLKENGGSFLIPLDENGDEIAEVVEHNEKILAKTQPLIDDILNDIKEWKADGSPE